MEATSQLPRLPTEIWTNIFNSTDLDYLSWERKERSRAAARKRRNEPEPDIPSFFLVSTDQWKQLASFMLVSKEWNQNVWNSISSLECGDGCLTVPIALALNTVLPKIGPQLRVIEISFARESDLFDEDEETTEEEKQKIEEKKKIRKDDLQKFFREIARRCTNLVGLLLPCCRDPIDLSELFSDGKMPSNWSQSLVKLHAHTLQDEQLRVICNGQTPLSSLKQLRIANSNELSGEAIAQYLPCLPQLTDLAISDLSLDEEWYEKLFNNLPNLIKLDAGWSHILQHKKAIAALGSCTRLKELLLPYAELPENEDNSPSIFAGLSTLKRLTKLDLGGNPVTDGDVQALTALTSLRILILYQAKISDNGLTHLQKLPDLTKLDVSSTSLSKAMPLLATLTSLTWLDIKYTHMYSGEEYSPLSKLTNLVNLQVTTSGEQLIPLAPLTRLRKLVASNDNPAGIKAIVETFPQLVRLEVSHTEHVDDNDVKVICSSLTNLRSLNLSGDKSLTDACLPFFLTRKLRHLSLPTTDILTEEKANEVLKPLKEAGCTIWQF